MAKDSPSFTIPVSPEAEHLLDRYLEEYRQRALLDAAVQMSERVGSDGVTFSDMKKTLIHGPFEEDHRKHLVDVIACEWNNQEEEEAHKENLKKLAYPGYKGPDGETSPK